MPKDFIKRYMPDHRTVRNSRRLRMFGRRLHDPNLWHLNRRSASGAFAVGLFMAFMPVPVQMILAAAAAIALRVNLVIAVALVWITNPFTIPPMFYSAYRLGAWLLGHPVREVHFEFSLDWMVSELNAIWEPLLVGCFVMGTVSAAAGFIAIRLLWRLRLVRHARRKKEDRARRSRATGG